MTKIKEAFSSRSPTGRMAMFILKRLDSIDKAETLLLYLCFFDYSSVEREHPYIDIFNTKRNIALDAEAGFLTYNPKSKLSTV